jgi:hypothetical protein
MRETSLLPEQSSARQAKQQDGPRISHCAFLTSSPTRQCG